MRWRTPDLRKAGIVITGILLLLVFKTWVPLSVASAHQGTLGLATPGTVTVQATPTEDATMTALSKEKLVQEVQQLKDQNEPDFFGWLRANASLLLSTLVVVVGGLIGLWRWLGDRRDAQEKVLKDQQSEREKRAEERFQAAVTGLADNKEGARIGAAILLRTFLRPGYEQFYTQTFDLAVANLRLPRTPPPPEDPDGLSHPPENPTVAQSLTTLSQALIVVYKESFPLARDTFLVHDIFKEEDTRDSLAFLDASHIQLDHAYLHTADLKQAWLPHAFLRKANLSKANLSKANLSEADLSEASLFAADLRAANLFDANLSRAGLSEANLSRAGLTGANLSEAKLRKTDLARADLRKTNLSGADLSEAKLTHADLHQAKLTHANFSGADLSRAKLIDADLRNTTLSKANLCKATLTGAKFIHDVDLIPNAKLRAAKVSKENRLLANFTRKILHLTNLSDVNFSEADLSKATLTGVTLTRANLSKANLSKANLLGADLSGADLSEARFLGADLIDAKLNGANLSGADLSEADLSGADLINVKLNGAQFDRAVLIECHLDGTNLEEAHSLEGTDLRGVKGLTKEQLEACKAKGAIIDEAPTSSASQSTTAPSPSSQSNDAQASSVPSAQGSASTPDAGGSSTVSPQQEPGS